MPICPSTPKLIRPLSVYQQSSLELNYFWFYNILFINYSILFHFHIKIISLTVISTYSACIKVFWAYKLSLKLIFNSITLDPSITLPFQSHLPVRIEKEQNGSFIISHFTNSCPCYIHFRYFFLSLFFFFDNVYTTWWWPVNLGYA